MKKPLLQTVVNEYFDLAEAQQITAFIKKGFSPRIEAIVASIFFQAKDCEINFPKTLAACEKEWERCWKNQHCFERVNPFAENGLIRISNRVSLVNICQTLKISDPFEKFKKIPKRSMVIKSCSSNYIIGREEENGERSITRDEERLTFSRCKITFFWEERFMQFVPIYSSSEEPWTFSIIGVVTI